ncbi:MAG: fused MFS/spermidine synthase, partial [Verrucomicrobiae bacterium]|nr:fused MFS/spermidine synthase [Verrucomicrobiae bacterium]
SVVLYFVPLTCMAMTVPFLIRAVSQSLANLGSRVGTLSAVSTVGSFLGTAGIGYVLIPLVANSTTMFGCAGVLALLATVYFAVFARRLDARAGAGAGKLTAIWVWLGLSVFLAQRQETAKLGDAVELFRGNSHFGMLQVVQVGPNSRYYLNDFLAQNIYDPEAGQSTAMFSYMLSELARAYTPEVKSALCIGMGVGIVPMDFARAGTRVDVVEINPAVVPLAEEFFDFESAKVNVIIDDGRHFLNAATNRYDAVILDAFLGDSSPAHLMSREAFAAMRRCLNEGGVLVINCFGELDARRNYFTASLDRTLRAVFKSVKIHAQGNGNLFFVASDQSELRRLHETDFTKVHPQARRWTEGAFARELTMKPEDGIVLTDDYNPVDYYDAANREELRKSLAFSMRGR